MTAVVIGATGAIGAAVADVLERRGDEVRRLGRRSDPPLDLLDEASIERAATTIAGATLVFDATGMLHDGAMQPEKSLRTLDAAHLAHAFAVNATGPALLMKHVLPRLPRDRRAVFATLSARVGSIADNRLGGWYAYRASKAALNQLVRTAAIELARTHPLAVCIALHPGTVRSPLSDPFVKAGLDLQDPAEAAARIVAVLDRVDAGQSGKLLDRMGEAIPF